MAVRQWTGALGALLVIGATAARAQTREQTSAAVGLEALQLYDGQDQFFKMPGLGLALSGEWRTGIVSIAGNGAIAHFTGKSLFDGLLQIPNVWLYTVGVAARVHPSPFFYVGPGVGVFSSSNDLDDEIGPTINAGLRSGRYELAVRYKATGINVLELRMMVRVRGR
jgi:hypothetical protein